MNDDRKRALKRQHRADEQAAARHTLGLTESQLRSLRDTLDASDAPCDHTLGRTREWAKLNGLDPVVLEAGVRAHGGFCDCEVLFNVDPEQFGWAED